MLAGLLVALGLNIFSSHTVSTFNRDIPLAAVTQEIELHLRQTQLATLKAQLDPTVDTQIEVFEPLIHASEDCQRLAVGGVSETGRKVPPLADADDQDSATQLCHELDAFQGLTAAVLRDAAGDGQSSAAQQRYNQALEQLISRNSDLTRVLHADIARDATWLSRVGAGASVLVAVMAGAAAVVVGRHRRLLAENAQQVVSLAAIVEASVDAVVGMSVDGLVTSWNPAAEQLYGYRNDEIVGRSRDLIVPAHRREEESALMDRARRGTQVQRYESDRLRKDGSTVPVALTLSPVFRGDAVDAIAAIGQDISELKAKDAALQTAREEALQSSRLKSEFLATMSHEIRTPMNGVIGLTSLLRGTALDDTQRQYAEGIGGSAEALLTVINDILDFSKLEAGKVELELASFDPRRVLDEVGSLLALTAHAKLLELIVTCRPEVPARLCGDAGRIRQVLLNLAANAVKFTTSGEVAITVRPIRVDADGIRVRFQVADTGIGITEEALPRMFESFSQADASTTRRFGGTGLGLAISRKLTQAMGGEIGVDSVIGAGSTFWFEIPFQVPSRIQAPSPPLRPELLHDLPVLVVDDNATNRLILKSQLTAWGMRPDVLEHPREALDRLHDALADGHPYAIAVLDMCMPELDGLELARRISSDRALAGTRLIMLTSTQVNGEELKEAGIEEWMAKPVRSSELYDRLMRLMAPSTATAAAHRGMLEEHVDSTPSLGRVLIVDDNALNQLVAQAMLTKLGYQVDIVSNGVEALDAITATFYAAVLMDCHMPVMDGLSSTLEIRRRQVDGDRIPIIAMTAAAMTQDRDRCLAVGMDDFISKPVSLAAIRDALARWDRQRPAPETVALDTAAASRNRDRP